MYLFRFNMFYVVAFLKLLCSKILGGGGEGGFHWHSFQAEKHQHRTELVSCNLEETRSAICMHCI